MLIVLRAACLCFVLSNIGCGGNREPASGEAPPHEGATVLMRGDKGVIEIVKKSGTAPIKAEVSFYFYKHPKETGGIPYDPWDSMPESGVLIMGKKKVELTLEGDALVTPTGPILFGKKEVDGELSIKVDGKDMLIPLEVR